MLVVNEVFYSLQGEGARAGHPSVFIRFSGCNMKCRVEAGPDSPGGFDCDTEFVSGEAYTEEALVEDVLAAAGECRWVVLTGGEPLLQVTRSLINLLKEQGFKIALETNGTMLIPVGLDWVVVSPKVAEHAIRAQYADELRYVRGVGQGIPKPSLDAEAKFLSPAFKGDQLDPEAVQTCIDLCLRHPDWALSVQAHKLWGVR